MRDVILNWQLGTNFGWGILGLNLFAQWANDTELRPVMGRPIELSQLIGVDALRMSRIVAATNASNEYLRQQGNDPARWLDAVCIDSLGNDFQPLSKRRASLMIGRAIFETSSREFARERLARYDLLLTASTWNATLIKDATGRDAHVIHEGVDVSLFCPGPRSGWLDPDRFYVFSGGKVEFRKAQDLVLLAFKRFAARHADAVLVAAWHSPWVNISCGFRGRLASALPVGPDGTLDVTRWVVENGIDADQVIDLGHVPNVLMPGILREMHVALQPSRAEACTNLPVKEAMACGLPVIAARNTGMLDLLTDDNCIMLRHQTPLCPADHPATDGWGESDLEEIDAALEFAYQNRAAAAATGARARQWLLDHGRTWQQHAATLKEWVLSHPAGQSSESRAIDLDSDSADAYLKRGNEHYALERWDAALADYDHALSIKPHDAEGHFNRGVLLDRSGRFESALESYDRAIEIKADYAEAHYNRGNVLHRLKQWDAALAGYDRAIASRVGFAEAYANRAVVQSELRQVDAALASCDQAIAIKDDYAEAHSNRGFLLQELRQWDAALASCNRAIAIKADYAEPYFNRSIVRLLRGDFENGWIDYEWRPKQRGRNNDRDESVLAQPRWLGLESLTGKTILIYSEQGLGDTLQFCRYVTLLADLGAAVIVEVQAPLAGLLSRLQGASQVLTRADPLPDFDYQCPMLSLPLAFKTHERTIPAAARYLHADAAKVSYWQAKLGQKSTMRIGLMWSGNPDNKRDQYRSIRLAELLPYLPAEFQYVSLQKEVREVDGKTLRSNPQIMNFADEQQDFEDTAALCECMDLVISVDTSVAHLSGALGKQTWILLSSTPDWRWLLDRVDSPWYPSVTLYRQETHAEWGAVLTRLKSDLLRRFPAEDPAAQRNAHLLLGMQHHRDGRLDAAADIYQRLYAADQRDTEVIYRMGVLCCDLGAFEAARRFLEQTLALTPAFPEARAQLCVALNGLAGAQLASGLLDEAENSLSQALASGTNDPQTLLGLGRLALARGDPAAAETQLIASLAGGGADAESLNWLGLAQLQQEKFAAAATSLRRALALRPDLNQACNNLGLALHAQGQLGDAQTCFEGALARDPSYTSARLNLAATLRIRGEPEAARRELTILLAAQPDSSDALNNLGAVLQDLGLAEPALACLTRAAALAPQAPHIRWNLALTQLQLGDFKNGWQNFEMRFEGCGHLRGGYWMPQDRAWRGESVRGKRLLLWAEQGFGDTLQFIRFAQDVARMGAQVTVIAPPELADLVRRVPGVHEVTVPGAPLPDYDFHSPLMSLPYRLGLSLEATDLHAATPYLSAAPDRIESWRQRLVGYPGMKVGLVWAGSARLQRAELAAIDVRRSIRLAALAPLLAVSGCTFFSLQKGSASAEIGAGLTLHDFSAEWSDFLDTAAFIANLDLVISVDTAVVHLAGAMGKPVWLLNRYDTCWRWLLERVDSPWYATLRQFRQLRPGEWAPAIAAIAVELEAAVGRSGDGRGSPAEVPMRGIPIKPAMANLE